VQARTDTAMIRAAEAIKHDFMLFKLYLIIYLRIVSIAMYRALLCYGGIIVWSLLRSHKLEASNIYEFIKFAWWGRKIR
jgi:hypothetical protein